jgi:hypothetical protein
MFHPQPKPIDQDQSAAIAPNTSRGHSGAVAKCDFSPLSAPNLGE